MLGVNHLLIAKGRRLRGLKTIDRLPRWGTPFGFDVGECESVDWRIVPEWEFVWTLSGINGSRISLLSADAEYHTCSGYNCGAYPNQRLITSYTFFMLLLVFK